MNLCIKIPLISVNQHNLLAQQSQRSLQINKFLIKVGKKKVIEAPIFKAEDLGICKAPVDFGVFMFC